MKKQELIWEFQAQGNIYVADQLNYKIRKISPLGVVTTFAGSGAPGSADGTGKAASFLFPSGVCSDAQGNIYVADRDNQKIRKISPLGVVTTFAGSGALGSADSTGTAASFNRPVGVCSDAQGNIYVADQLNNKIRKISPLGVVTTFAGSGADGSADGMGSAASFNVPVGVCSDALGNIYVADYYNHIIRKLIETTPAVPVANYLNLPGAICMGSSVDSRPSVTGGIPNFVFQLDSFPVPAPKAICKNNNFVYVLDANDSIKKYDFSGNLVQSIGNWYLNVTSIAADTAGRLYVVAPDNSNPSLSNIYRYDAAGNLDFGFNIPSFILNNISAITVGPDGFIYAADTTAGYINKIDPVSAAVSNLPSPSPQFSFYKPTGIAFGKGGEMYMADIGLKTILKRNAADNNYYRVIPGYDTLDWEMNSISIDTSGLGTNLFLSSATTQPPSAHIRIELQNGDTLVSILDTNTYVNSPAGMVVAGNAGTAPAFWFANTAGNNLKKGIGFVYTIAPPLPSGLSYDFKTGAITGTALAPAALTTYTVTTTNQLGTGTKTISFSVDPPGSLSNSPGTNTASGNHTDGLTVNYFSANNCSPMVSIKDSVGGTTIGNIVVRDTVYPTVASFSSGTFVRRVTDINTNNSEADARLKLYFTYQDIQNFNAGNGGGTDLSNDTTGGTMQVAVLQLHKDSTGHTQQIKHNPITAMWVTGKYWQVDFPVTKFSTFYTGETGDIAGFNCANTGVMNVTACTGNYTSPSGLYTYTVSGTYLDTLVNKNGCDSIVTINLTLNGSSSEQIVNACGSYVWQGNTITYVGTSAYLDTIPNAFGCDSLMRLEVTLFANPNLAVNATGAVLTSADSTALSYQWINCTGNTIINGATSQSYTATASGNYAVIVTTAGNCSDTSACVNVTATGVEHEANSRVMIYPNPNNGAFTIATPENIRVEITSILGEIILVQEFVSGNYVIDLSSQTKGIYTIQIKTDKKIIINKMVIH